MKAVVQQGQTRSQRQTIGLATQLVLLLLCLIYPFQAKSATEGVNPVSATASSREAEQLGPQFSIDKKMTTRWASAHTDNQWIFYDFGKTVSIDEMVIHWEAAYGSAYHIYSAVELGNWKLNKTIQNGDGGEDRIILDFTGRYLLIYGAKRGTPYGYSIYEVEFLKETLAPPLAIVPNTVTASSMESSATTPQMSMDKNMSTRWSSAHSDNQWIFYDFGKTVSINEMVIHWEAAFGSDYHIFSAEALGNWKLNKTVQNGDGGEDRIILDFTGRYLLIYGAKRGTPYGYSIFEVAFFAQKATPPPTIIPTGVSASSVESSATTAAMSIDKNMSTRWASAHTDNQYIFYDFGKTVSIDEMVIHWEAAYGSDYRIYSSEGGNWEIIKTIQNGDGGEDRITLDFNGRYLMIYGIKRGTPYGYSIFELEFFAEKATPPPTIIPTGVSASSVENSATTAAMSIDQNMSTRWASAHTDNQWIFYDFGKTVSIDEMVIHWEAAYGSDYRIYSSEGGNWEIIKTIQNGNGGEDRITLDFNGRYLMIYGIKRGTPYGYSIFEVAFYPADTVDPVNQAPAFTSNPITQGNENEEYNYQLSGTDPDGDSLVFTLINPPAGMSLINPATQTPIIRWTPTYEQAGVYPIKVQLQDQPTGVQGTTIEQVFELTISHTNRPPVFMSEPVTSALEGVPYAYQLQASDPDGDPLECQLVSGPAGMFIQNQTLQWAPDFNAAGDYTIVLNCKDTHANAQQTFVLTVNNNNRLPSINSLPPTQAQVGVLVNYRLIATDADGDPITFQLHQAPTGMTIQDQILVDGQWQADLRWTPTNESPVSFEVRALDPDGAFDTQPISLTIAPAPNTAPRITSALPAYRQSDEEPFSFQVQAEDTETPTNLIYELSGQPSGMAISPTGLISWTPTQDTFVTMGVLVKDPRGESDQQSFDMVFGFEDSDPPDINFISHEDRQLVTESTLPLQAEIQSEVGLKDLKLNGQFIEISSVAPGQVNTIDQSLDMNQDFFTITIEATDIFNRTSSKSIEVTRPILPIAITASSFESESVPPAFSMDQNMTTRWASAFTDNEWIQYEFDRILSFTDIRIFWEAAFGSQYELQTSVDGIHWLTEKTVLDGDGGEDRFTQNFTGRYFRLQGLKRGTPYGYSIFEIEFYPSASLLPFNSPPLSTSNPITQGNENEEYNYRLSANDPDGDPLVFSLIEPPEGMTLIDPDTQAPIIRWTPTFDQAGVYPIKVQLQDQPAELQSYTIEQEFELTISNTNRPPEFTSTPLTTALEGAPYVYHLQARDPDGDQLVYELISGPEGMFIQNQTLQWTPGYEAAGDYPIVLQIKDTHATVEQAYVISVNNNNRIPVFHSLPPTQAQVGVLVQYRLAASDPDGDEIQFQLHQAPAGMSIQDRVLFNGQWLADLRWTPTTEAPALFQVHAVDPYGAVNAQQLNLTVAPAANTPPQITSAPPAYRQSDEAPFSFQIETLDAETPDDLIFEISSQPSGMTISPTGFITWTPIQDTFVSMDVLVRDPRGEYAQQSFDMVFGFEDSNPPEIRFTNLEDQQVIPEGTLQIQADILTPVGLKALKLNGQALDINSSGPGQSASIDETLTIEQDSYTITVEATDIFDRTSSASIEIFLDTEGPDIQVFNLEPAPVVNQVYTNPYRLRGMITETRLSQASVNGTPLQLEPGSSPGQSLFDVVIELTYGLEHSVLIEAIDDAGHQQQLEVIIEPRSTITIDWLEPAPDAKVDARKSSIKVTLQATGLTGTEQLSLTRTSSGEQLTQTLGASQGYISASVPIAGEGMYTILLEVRNDTGDLLTSTSRQIEVINVDPEDQQVLRLQPARGELLEPNGAISLFLAQPVTLPQVLLTVTETANGLSYVNQDEPGLNNFQAKGYGLAQVNRQNEAVPGDVSITSNGSGVIFYPLRDFAYGATVRLTLSIDDQTVTRQEYQVKPRPTFIQGYVLDSFGQGVASIDVVLKGTPTYSTTTDTDGAYAFGFSPQEKDLQGGQYEILVNQDLKFRDVSNASKTVNIEQGSLNRLQPIKVNTINTEIGYSPLKAGQAHQFNAGEIQLDASSAQFDWPTENQIVQFQFRPASQVSLPVAAPLFSPLFYYTASPLGIGVTGSLSLDLALPQYRGSRQYLPGDDAWIVFMGLDETGTHLTPVGVGQAVNGIRVQSRGILHQTRLDYLGIAPLIPTQYKVATDYASGSISIGELRQALKDFKL